MCGIAGHIDKKGMVNSLGLKRMADSIRHRGPDDFGYKIFDSSDMNIGLCFQRLSIIDTSSLGHQPMCNEDGTIWIVFNGEVYNFRELRKDLLKRGHQFKSQTDTEVVISLYEEYKEKFVEHMDGMFALAIWDGRTQSLICARDRFGIKPFYYYADKDRFIFASEIKAIRQVDGLSMEIDEVSLDEYFAYGHIGGTRSIFKNIRKLKPGHILRYTPSSKKIKVEKYWEPVFDPDESVSEDDWCSMLEEEISRAVKSHMVSDVPIGAFLSGGLDSSIVVANMAKLSDNPIKTFSIGFHEAEFNELDFARQVAEAYHTDHHEMIVEPTSIDLLPKLVNAYDEPFADSSAIPTYFVSEFAREHVKVVLSGDGGDELFAGYSGYLKLLKINKMNFKSDMMRNLIWSNLYKFYPSTFKGKEILYQLSTSKSNLHARLPSWPLPDRKKFYKNDFRAQVSIYPAEKYREQLLSKLIVQDDIQHSLNIGIRTSLTDGILTKVDRVSMQHSLEVRVPILDHKLAELTFKIPSSLKLKNGEGKYILKRAMASLLPESVISHPKQGFNVPLKYWFKKDFNEYLSDRFNSSNSRTADYLDYIQVRKLIKQQQHGMRDQSSKLWRIIFFDEWMNMHYSRTQTSEKINMVSRESENITG